jgi:hypothetical protein
VSPAGLPKCRFPMKRLGFEAKPPADDTKPVAFGFEADLCDNIFNVSRRISHCGTWRLQVDGVDGIAGKAS